MTKKKILVLLGHPNKESTSGYLANEYERGAREVGHDVKRTNIGDLNFDPILHKGYREIQALEPDLLSLQEEIRWAEHIAIFYPNWWGAMPALMKGMIDRMWLPGFGFRFNKDGFGWMKLLKGRSSRVVVTMDTHPFLARILFGDTSNEIKKCVLEFSGISPVSLTRIGPVKTMSERKKKYWMEKIFNFGKNAK